MNRPTPATLALIAAAPVAAPAQGIHAVPPAYLTTEAPALTGVAGIGISDREQILVDASMLTELEGKEIVGILFRRDGTDATSFAGGTAHLVVQLGIPASSADSARPSFTANASTLAEVFRGPVSIPASAPPPGMPTWTPPDVVEITFGTPFRYSGGGLCLDIVGAVAAEFWWSVDAASQLTRGTVTSEGRACGRLAAAHGDTAAIAEHDLVVGESVICTLFGEPGAPAFLLVGLDTFAAPIDLLSLGAPGCEVRADAFVSLGTTVSRPPLDPAFGGIAERVLHLPSNPSLAGSGFVAQWCELPGASITTSNTLRCTIAATRPSLGMSVVWSRGGSEPIVQFTRVPVVGLRWR